MGEVHKAEKGGTVNFISLGNQFNKKSHARVNEKKTFGSTRRGMVIIKPIRLKSSHVGWTHKEV